MSKFFREKNIFECKSGFCVGSKKNDVPWVGEEGV